MKNCFRLFLICLVAIQISCTEEIENTEVEKVATEATSDEIKAILNHHLTAFGENNMDEVLKDYTEESIIITQDAELIGLEAIKGLFTSFFELFPAGASDVTIDVMKAEGGVGYFTWHGESDFVKVDFGADSFTFKDGKIHRQTFAGIITPKEQPEATE